MATDYTAIDAAIMKRIGDGARSMGDIDREEVAKLSKAIADARNAGIAYKWRQMPSWYVVDRRLQALRKAGKIVFKRGGAGWEVV